MQYLQRLELGDKIFFINDANKIIEIELNHTHLDEDEIRRHAIAKNYQLKSSVFASGGDIQLEKVTVYEEIDDHYVKQRRLKREDTYKVAYLSFEEAQAHLNDMIYQRSVMTELQEDADRELESHLKAINLILSDYFDRVDRHDIEATILNNDEEYKRLLELRNRFHRHHLQV